MMCLILVLLYLTYLICSLTEPPNLGPLGKIILIGVGAAYVIDQISGSDKQDSPKLPIKESEPVPTPSQKPAFSPEVRNSETSPSWKSASPNTLGAGGVSYTPSNPTQVGDTEFINWGTTASGAQVISINDPSTYDPWEWY